MPAIGNHHDDTVKVNVLCECDDEEDDDFDFPDETESNGQEYNMINDPEVSIIFL